MILDRNTAQKTAELLLQIKAIKLNLQESFTWSSGWKSPIYCDNRVILSYPEARDFIKKNLAEQLKNKYGMPDAVAGVATGGIGIGALVADELNLPFAYIRPKPKKHGRQNRIEGHLKPGQKVVVIEDLISTGGSSLNAVKALKESDIEVVGLLAIFSYGFDVSQQNFEKQKVDYGVLSNYQILIEQAVKAEYLKEEDLETLKAWRETPDSWDNK